MRAFVAVLAVALATPGQPARAAVCADSPATPRCETWARQFNGPGFHGATVADEPGGLAVSGDGRRVFVATTTSAGGGPGRITLAALDGADGVTRWAVHPPSALVTSAQALTLTPDGSRAVVAGTVLHGTSQIRWYTAAYATAFGAPLWSAEYALGDNVSTPVAVAASPRGDRVYVFGHGARRVGSHYVSTLALVAYATADGRRLWAQTYGGATRHDAGALAVSPRGDAVYVTGRVARAVGDAFDVVTVAYDAGTGHRRWVRLDSLGGASRPVGVGVSAAGDRVVVTSADAAGRAVTTGYDAAGRSRWRVPETGVPAALAVAGDGAYVAGDTTYAYHAGTGQRMWTAAFAPAGVAGAAAQSVVADGTRVYVVGTGGAGAAYPVTVAYGRDGTPAWVARWDLRDPAGAGEARARSVVLARTGAVYEAFRYDRAAAPPEGVACNVVNTAGQQCPNAEPSALLLAYAP